MKMKMKKGKSLLMALGMCVVFAGMMTGCSETNHEEIALAIVGSPHSNEPGFPLNAATVKEEIYNCCYTYGEVSFISCDGNPKVVYQADIPEPEKSGLSENKKKTIATNYVDQLLAELSKVKAETPQVDTLKAITYGAKVLAGSNENAEKVLVIMDNGLSTVGYVDDTKGLLNANPEEVVSALEEADAIPDLNGVHVVWMYLGQTALPQEELSETQKQNLENRWKLILQAGGAASVEFRNDIASDDPDPELPEVSTVDVQDRTIQVEAEQPLETIVLDQTTVKFIGDKAEFVNYEEAVSVLQQYAEILLEHPNNKVYVIGTTAKGDETFCKELSRDRANQVCQVLISCGVPETQLIPMGLGYSDPWHIEDEDEYGHQLEEYAAQNRKVLIIDTNGEDAAKIQEVF